MTATLSAPATPAAPEPSPAELALLRLIAAEHEVNAANLAVLQSVATLQSARSRLSAAQLAVLSAGVIAAPGSPLSQ